MRTAVAILCVILGVVSADLPKWPDQYMIQGTLELPYAEIEEPFTAFFDKPNNRSRIDYYGDLVVTIQLGATAQDPKGSSYKVAPMTNDLKNITNMKMCFSMAGTPLEPVGAQSIFPDLTGFEYVAEGKMREYDCSIYQLITKIGGKKNTYTIWVSTEKGVPVRYEMMGYDSLLGSHYDKYYVDYEIDSLEVGKGAVPDIKFNVTAETDISECGGFPGPGNDAEHRILFNPMREYMHGDDSHVTPAFDSFKRRHAKSYDNEEEHRLRRHVFQQNLRFIHSTNRAGKSYRVAVNHLADRLGHELKALRGFRVTPGHVGGLPFSYTRKDLKDLPDYVDWRLFGAVTPVKDQAVCGSCWSFGTAGAVEGAHFLKTGQLVRLSQQALMDCSWGEGNNACDGGEDFRAYEWIMRHGLPTEESYGPYMAQDGYCHFKNATTGATMKNYVKVKSGDLDALKVAMFKNGPISVAIDASHKSLSFYSNGVYYEEKCGSGEDSLDHAVLAVGYGELKGQAYWLVKNSWSTYWGNDGYVLMAQRDNNCGVATAATYVVM